MLPLEKYITFFAAGVIQSEVTFSATAGVIYHIAVDGYRNHSGDIILNWSME